MLIVAGANFLQATATACLVAQFSTSGVKALNGYVQKVLYFSDE